MYVYVAELKPVRLSDGVEQTLRYCSHPSASRTDGQDWLPVLAVPFRRNTQIFDGEFQDQPQDYGSMEIAFSRGHSVLPLTMYGWDARRVTVWRGTAGQPTSAMTKVFTGTAESVSGTKRRYTLKLRGPSLDKPVLGATYAGTGGVEGPAELKGTLKPMLIGNALNIEPVYVNRALGIAQVHGYGVIGGNFVAYDSGAQLGASVGDYADYAALAAANVPAGRIATCVAQGLVRHGGEITGVFTVDAVGVLYGGYPNNAYPGDVLSYLVGTVQGLASADYVMADFSWLNAQIPHAHDWYITEQMTVEEACRRFMLSLGGYVWYTDDGRFTIGLLRRGAAATVSLGPQNIAEGLNFRPSKAPVYQRRQGYQRSWRVHSYSEVRTPAEIKPRGDWTASPDPVYQYYDLVAYGPNSYIYVSGTAGSAAVPGTDPAVWELFQSNGAAVVESESTPTSPVQGMLWRRPSTGMISWYDGGVWVQLADITAAHTAAAITGQGALATKNLAAWSSDVSGRPPLFTGEAITADERLADPSLWGGLTPADIVAASPDNYVSSTAAAPKYFHATFANATPIDPQATYEAYWDLLEEGAGAGTGTFYLMVVAWDAAGAVIPGDGSYWYYPVYMSGLPARGSRQRFSARFGNGTSRPFPVNAVRFSLGALLNYTNTGNNMRAYPMWARRVESDWLVPHAATLRSSGGLKQADRSAIIVQWGAVGWGSWNNGVYSRAAITGPCSLQAKVVGAADSGNLTSMMGLAVDAAPTSYATHEASFYHVGTPAACDVHAYFANAGGSSLLGSSSTVGRQTFRLDYDGLFYRWYIDGVQFYSRYAGPGLTHRAAFDCVYEGQGYKDIWFGAADAKTIIGGNTYRSSDGAAYSQAQLVTSEGTSAAIAGQGALATLNQISTTQMANGTGGENLVPNPNFWDGASVGSVGGARWNLGGMSFYSHAGTGHPGGGSVYNPGGGAATYRECYANDADNYVIPGGISRLHLSGTMYSGPNVPLGSLLVRCSNRLGTVLGYASVNLGLSVDSTWIRRGGWVDLPDGTDRVLMYWAHTSDPTYSVHLTGMRVSTSEPAADVTSMVQGVAESMIACDYTGAIKAGQVNPRYVPFKLIRNGVDVTESATWSAAVASGSATVSMSDTAGTKGRLNITGAASNSTVTITAAYAGATRTMTHTITRILDAPPQQGGGGSGGGGSASGTVSNSPFGTTMIAIGDELTVTVGSGGSVALSAYGDWVSDQSSGSQTCYTRWYKWNGSAYVAIGTETASEAYVPSGGLPASWGCNYTDTGNTASSTQKYRLYGRAGGSYTASISGSCSAVAS